MNILAYDTETTGLSQHYDRPLQFAACLYDDQLNLIQETNIRGRLPRYVLPHPEALLTSGRSITQIQNAPLSHWQLMRSIANEIAASSPAIMVTFNGIKYDDEILRHSFYANLMAPYLTQLNGNTRLDVLRAARAVNACAPGKLNLPRDAEGKTMLKLDRLAEANGFVGHSAHDALSDVHATMHVLRVLAEKAPKVWDKISQLRRKEYVREIVKPGQPVLAVGWSRDEDGPSFRVIVPIISDEKDRNEWLCIALDADVIQLKAMDVDALVGAFQSDSARPLVVRIKINAMPLLLTMDDAKALQLPTAFDPFKLIALKTDHALAERLRAASILRKSRYAEPTEVWGQLYSGGFFPLSQDKPVVERFHQAPPQEKWEMISDLTDPRARKMARWLVGSEWPEVLGRADRQWIEDEFHDHLMRPEAKWTTVPS